MSEVGDRYVARNGRGAHHAVNPIELSFGKDPAPYTPKEPRPASPFLVDARYTGAKSPFYHELYATKAEAMRHARREVREARDMAPLRVFAVTVTVITLRREVLWHEEIDGQPTDLDLLEDGPLACYGHGRPRKTAI